MMVVEHLVMQYLRKGKKLWIILAGFLYTLLALFLAVTTFQEQASLLFVFLTVFAVMPFIYKTILLQEEIDLKEHEEKSILKAHALVLTAYVLLFLGITFGTAVGYLMLPLFVSENVAHQAFLVQEQTIEQVRNSQTGFLTQMESFKVILLNNLKVLSLCLIFSFLYGLGAIFILTWNASVVGVAIGQTISYGMSKVAGWAGITTFANYFNVLAYSVFRYLFHGIFEIAGYFIMGLAGGIISFAVIKHDFGTKKYYRILLDTYDLILLALGFIVVGALLEVFVTPWLFS